MAQFIVWSLESLAHELTRNSVSLVEYIEIPDSYVASDPRHLKAENTPAGSNMASGSSTAFRGGMHVGASSGRGGFRGAAGGRGRVVTIDGSNDEVQIIPDPNQVGDVRILGGYYRDDSKPRGKLYTNQVWYEFENGDASDLSNLRAYLENIDCNGRNLALPPGPNVIPKSQRKNIWFSSIEQKPRFRRVQNESGEEHKARVARMVRAEMKMPFQDRP